MNGWHNGERHPDGPTVRLVEEEKPPIRRMDRAGPTDQLHANGQRVRFY